MTGSHPRHAYLARSVAESGLLCGLIIENRETFVPAPPEGLRPGTRELFVRHFADREASEARFFPEAAAVLENLPTIRVEPEEINGSQVVEFLRKTKPDLLLSYGVHKLAETTLNCVEGYRWNIHGGLSPWYRGVITHFWPSYFLEPQMTGMTVHETTQNIDGGGLVHQNAAPLVPGDGIHDLACRAVFALGRELPELLGRVAQGRFRGPEKQRTTGRIWRSQDWRPEHLHVVYDAFGNRIVDHYLAGEFMVSSPKLVRQF
jgi:folate-dependent phosphoribosylglycinamide formyltransferase PurN